MQARSSRSTALVCVMLLGDGCCLRSRSSSESADQTPAPAETPAGPVAGADRRRSRAPHASADRAPSVSSPHLAPTPSPDPVPAVPTDTPSPTPRSRADHRRAPVRSDGCAPETPRQRPAVPADPTAQDLMAERLRQFVQEGIREEFPEAEDQSVHVFPLGLSDAAGEFWGVVTDGPQPFKITADDEAVNFWHFAAAYQLSEENEWIEVDRLEIELAPQRTQVDLTPTGWALLDGAPVAWITVRGGTGAHGGTLNIIRFDGETLRTELSWLSSRARYAGEVADLDGDGTVEVVVDNSNPYVFCYVCAVELKREILYWWDGSRLVPVDLRAPIANVPDGVADQVDEVLALAQASLWRDAALAAIASSQAGPRERGGPLALGSGQPDRRGAADPRRIDSTAAADNGIRRRIRRGRRSHARARSGAGVRARRAAHRRHGGGTRPFHHGHPAARPHHTGVWTLAPDRAEIHAVHALALTLASPDDLAGARSAMQRAAELGAG